MIVRVLQKNENPGRRRNVPAWLTDPDQPAPCICGMPLQPGQHYIVGTGETGLQRWFHMECWANGMVDEDDDDDDNIEKAYHE